MIKELKEILGSNLDALDFLYLIEDLKPVARILCYHYDLEKIDKLLKAYKLHAALSDFKIVKKDKGDYSNKGIKVSKLSEKLGKFALYISKDPELAKKAKALEEAGDHVDLGKLLGYPECCCKFFQENYAERSQANNDYVLPAFQNSEGFEFKFYTNIMARYFDYSLLSHFPCSFECEESIKLAKEYLDKLVKIDTGFAKELLKMLMSAAVYTEFTGKFIMVDTDRIHNMVKFNELYGTDEKSRLFNDLQRSESFSIIDRDNIRIDDLNIKDQKLCVFLFS